jgi:hypothetical protein
VYIARIEDRNPHHHIGSPRGKSPKQSVNAFWHKVRISCYSDIVIEAGSGNVIPSPGDDDVRYILTRNTVAYAKPDIINLFTAIMSPDYLPGKVPGVICASFSLSDVSDTEGISKSNTAIQTKTHCKRGI